MYRTLAIVVALTLALAPTAWAVGKRNAEYVGGTLTDVAEKTEGPFRAGDAAIQFSWKKRRDEGEVVIPYDAITSLEYGQNAGRRVAVAVLVSPLALFSKKRNHYLTLTFKDAAGVDQAAVFELGKDIVRTTLTVLETRTGLQVEFQDEEARKSGLGR